MAHNLYGSRLVLANEPGWHNLGKVIVGQKLTLKQALKESGCDFSITCEPIPQVVINGMEVDTSSRVMIIRHPNLDDPSTVMLDIVSNDYKLVTNQELVEYYDELSTHYPVETMGALGRGEAFFFTLDSGEVEVNGELLHQYFMVTDNKIGLQRTRVAYTPIRVVCQNTLISGLRAATMDIAIPHRTGNKDKLKEIAGLAVGMKQRQEEVNKFFGIMGETHISLEEFKKVCEEVLYRDGKVEELKPGEVEEEDNSLVNQLFNFEVKQTKAEKDRELVYALAEKYNDESSTSLKGSIWNYWNAVVEKEDWQKGRGDGQYSSALFGQRANKKVDAFNALTSFIK